ncbi:MAG: transglutaminase-like domain-containing protein [Betaproteobacteria bacterium]
MNAPSVLIGAGLLFWGWQTGHPAVGAVLALLVALAARARLRFDLGPEQHATIADLSTIGFILLAAILAANRGIAHGILQAFVWLPAALSPILAAQLLSREGRIPLSALFRHMRKLKRVRPDTVDPMVDVAAVYLVLTLLAAGVANDRGPWYYAGIVLATALLLHPLRPRHGSLAAGAAMLVAAAGIGHAGHLGLAQLQANIEDWILDLNLRVMDSDPYRSRTEIGSVGRLKQYDAIVLRVFVPPEESGRVRLLHRSSYNAMAGNVWIARGAPMEEVRSEADNLTWNLEPGVPQWKLRIATRMDSGRALLALPPGTTRLAELPANAMRRNVLGSVHIQLPVDWTSYEAQGGGAIAGYAAPDEDDVLVPTTERQLFERAAADLGLRGLPAAEAMRRVERFLGGFSYSTFRERAVPAGESALGDFLNRSRSGHCEYFAAASTLLLRAAGVPARYATGFSVQEYSRLEAAYVVRARHAHAWTRVWDGLAWVDLDTTPAAWFEEEAKDAPLWQGISDLLRWAGFRWSQRGEFKAGDAWYGVLVVLAIYLAWSVFRGRRRVREEASSAAVWRRYPGEDSEFYAVEKALPAREASEAQARWVERVGKAVPPEKREALRDALRLHSRYRFDPEGISAAERTRLRELCAALSATTT